MTSGQQDRSARRKRRKAASGSLVAHPAYAPVLGLWGALLGASAVMVVPPVLIASAAKGTFLATLGGLAQPLVAGLLALVLGGVLFIAASATSRRARRQAAAPSVAELAVRRVRPIDPARDLGGRSLDDPIETMPFATPAWRDADLAEPEPAPADVPTASAPELADEPAGEPAGEPTPAPIALDLGEFAEFPGRNAVWVEQAPAAHAVPDAVPENEPVACAEPMSPAPKRDAAPPPLPGTAALARLRAVPTSELSMAEMVERFAAALHEHRASPPARALTSTELAAREAALAEALKALATLSGDESAGAMRAPLQAALAQLHQPRRASGGVA